MDADRYVLTGKEWDADDWVIDQQNLKHTHRSTLVFYRTDAVLDRSYRPACAGVHFSRGNVKGEPTKRSLQNLVFLLNNCDTPMTSMITMTMTPQVHRMHDADTHKAALKAGLEKLRRQGVNQYCWVREHQASGSVHWHVFTDWNVESPGQINDTESQAWSHWFADYYGDRKANQRSHYFMKNGDGKDFRGCVRVEQLLTEAAGRYAGKEGAKRFQKEAPTKWRRAGCAWWRASRNVKCTPVKTETVQASTLDSTKVMIGGWERDVAFRVQFNRGLKGE